jgi:group II intron reverse transcriptase/maturase
MILEAIYEPVFLPCSHGFRPNRSCHTALAELKKSFTGVKWFIEGDVKGCFDNIDHHVLISLIERKIKDARFIQLLWKFLKAGYMEHWQYNNTYSGVPQGGIVSPLLANIYLHELDQRVMSEKVHFDVPRKSYYNSAYSSQASKVHALRAKIHSAEGEERPELIKAFRNARKIMQTMPAKLQADKRLVYIRYADDFIIGVNGDKADCERIKASLGSYVGNTLKMELSAEKTLITHSSEKARFLGYDVRVRRANIVKPDGQGHTRRTLNCKVELCIPFKDKIERFLFEKGAVRQDASGTLRPRARTKLAHLSDLEIVTAFNAELRGICGYYSLAVDYAHLNYFSYLMEYSCLKTMACKHKSSVAHVIKENQDGKRQWGIPYTTQEGRKRRYFVKHHMCKGNSCVDVIPMLTTYIVYARSSLETRLKAEVCEMCGKSGVKLEFHHVNKVKNLQGKHLWERMMIARRRKTLAVCKDCHHKIHFG